MPLAAGTRLGPYEVVAPLGTGGMGEVYRARDPRLSRDVAIKVLPAGLSQDPARLLRFEHEAKAVGALNHPHILAVHDVGRHGGMPYVVSELLEGQTLRERLAGGALAPRKAIEIAAQISKGLAAAHEKGIVHRDLKPDNVFVGRDGHVKILDFGLAKLTQPFKPEESGLETQTRATDPGTVMGTASYMSPEQVRGQAVDHRSDVFSLGAILYEMLAGRRAFKHDTSAETMAAILKEDPPDLTQTNPGLPPALERIVRHCLEKSPEERFASARDLAFDLFAVSEASAPLPAAARWRASSPRLWGMAALLGMALVGALAFWLGRRTGPSPVSGYLPLTFRRGTITGARASPDGSVFFYSAAWDGGTPRIYSTRLDAPGDLDLGLEGQLVGVGGGDLYALRPNGVLLRATLSGTGAREVAEGVTLVDVSRDGSQLLLVRRKEGTDRLEFPVGQQLYETPGRIVGARLSPVGDRIALVEQPNAGTTPARVGVLDPGGRVEWLTPLRLIGAPAWAPDGSEVRFSTLQIGRWALRGVTPSGRERVLLAAAQEPRLRDVLPDGRTLLELAQLRREVRGLGPDQAGERDITWLSFSVALDLASDGRAAVLSSRISSKKEFDTYLSRFDGKPPVRLGEGLGCGLSPDGRWVAALAQEFTVLALLPTGASEPKRLPPGGVKYYYDARWLSDGKRLLFAGNEEGRARRLFLQDVASGTPRPVTPEGVAAEYPIPSPDGKWVAAGVDWRRAPYALYPLDGGEPQPIPGLEKGEEPLRFDGDGTRLFVRTDARDQPSLRVARLDLRTGRRETWKEIRPADTSGVPAIEEVYLTPDGRNYIYSHERTLSTLYLVEGLR